MKHPFKLSASTLLRQMGLVSLFIALQIILFIPPEGRETQHPNSQTYNTFDSTPDKLLRMKTSFQEQAEKINKKNQEDRMIAGGLACTGLLCIMAPQITASFLAGFSSQDNSVALGSAILNTILTGGVLCLSESTKYGFCPLMIAASVCSWIYWHNAYYADNKIHDLWVANTVLTSLVPILMLGQILCNIGLSRA